MVGGWHTTSGGIMRTGTQKQWNGVYQFNPNENGEKHMCEGLLNGLRRHDEKFPFLLWACNCILLPVSYILHGAWDIPTKKKKF